MIRWLAVLFAALLAAPAWAAAPLRLDEVLATSARHAPQIVEAMMRVRQAEGRLTTARGAFDTVFEGDTQARPFGYYDGVVAEVRASRPFATNGGGLYGGYRVAAGDFPVYENRNYTNRWGEAKVGAIFSLMRDRYVDERRTRLDLATTDIDVARLEGEMVAIGVQRRAISAYQAWVVAGLRVATYRDLLALAEGRQASIARQIALGSRPDILRTENEQNIVRRRALLVRAEQELATAANELSFFYRDEAGDPVTPTPEQLPATFPALEVAPLGPDGARRIARPDLDAILVRIDQADARLRLAENDLRPRLDLRAEAVQEIGPVRGGGPNLSSTEAVVGLRFSVPLERRAARGRAAEARAEIDGLRTRRRLIEDQIMVEVNSLAIGVEAADRLTALAADETALADRMAAAERRRFGLGASDFLVVNLREEAAADARLRQVDAEYRRAVARAELVTAMVDRRQLGLQPG